MKMFVNNAPKSASARHWLRSGPSRILIPLMLWCAAAATGGLFVYGCSTSDTSPSSSPSPSSSSTPGSGATPPPSTYSVSVIVSGLPATATAQALVLQDNLTDNLNVIGNGISTFATFLASQAAYSVTVLTQPTGFKCTVGSTDNPASGTVNGANVENIPVTCVAAAVATYTIGGSISGLPTTATAQALVLQDNGGDNFTVPTGATAFLFATALANQAAYSVTVLTQPTGFKCTVGSTDNPASGTVNGANVGGIPVVCVSTSGLAGATVLATVTNVQPSAPVFYNSTVSFYSISSPASASVAPAPPVQIGASLALSNVIGIAVDSANYVYYLNNSGSLTSAATYNVCTPPTASGGSYSCASAGSATLLGAQWLAVDGLGNAYVTVSQGAGSGVVAFNAKTGPGTTNWQVYGLYGSASLAPGGYYGLAVSVDGTTIYVAEGTTGITSGQGVTVHSCAISLTTTCADSAANDVTALLLAAANPPAFGPSIEFSGALAVGPQGTLYVGEGTPSGLGSALSMTAPVALVCVPGTVYHCATGSQAFNYVEGDLLPFVQAAAVAADPSGNAYVAASLNALGDNSLSTPPAPSFMAFLAGPASATSLTPFFCGTTIPAPAVRGGLAEPNCPTNLLPAPGVIDYKSQKPLSPTPYSMAITLPSK